MDGSRNAVVRRESSALEAPTVSSGPEIATNSSHLVVEDTSFDDLLALPDDHNEQELKRLVKAIEMSLGEFTFFLVRCDDFAEQKDWVERLSIALPNLRLQHIELKHQEDSLLLYLRRNPIPESTDIILLTGLEHSINSVYDMFSETFLRDINLRRNSFYKEIPKPIIFFGNFDFQRKIMIHAPDFFSIRSSLFYFKTMNQITNGISLREDPTILVSNALENVFPKISELDALIVSLRIFQEMPFYEISKTLIKKHYNINESSIRQRYISTISLLREYFNNYNSEYSNH